MDSRCEVDSAPEPYNNLTNECFRHANREHPVMLELMNLGQEPIRTAQPPGQGRNKENFAEYFTEKFRKKLKIALDNIKLPALPQIIPKLQQTINDPMSSASDLAEVISLDPSLSTLLLRIVNSAFYGFPSKIDTITKAVTLIGSRQLYTLAIGAIVLDLLKAPIKSFNMELFWRHSVACAVIARAIAAECGRRQRERYFVAGLLHDIGRLALFQAAPDITGGVVSLAQKKSVPVLQAERKLLGFDHGEFGAILLNKWSFPPALTEAVRYHHFPSKAKRRDESDIVHLADIVVKASGIGLSGDFYVPPLVPRVWEDLKLSPDDLMSLVKGLETEIEDTFRILTQK
jgi:putative nucleotidyltransferase with HDIG domain